MKILAFLIPAIVNIAVGAVLFFMLIIGLNGYSGRQAEPGLILYIVWVLLGALIAGVLSLAATNFLINKKSFGPVGAVLLSALALIVGGGIFAFVGIFAAIILIEALR